MFFRRNNADIAGVFVVALVLILSLAGLLWKWPFAMQFLALLHFLRWSVTTIYVSLPIVASGYWFARRVLQYPFDESPIWSILVAWTTGIMLIIFLGLILLATGFYTVWVWIFLALVFNLGIVWWLISKRWRPVVTLWQEIIPVVREDIVGTCSGTAKIWNRVIFLILTLAFFYALIPPNTLDAITYHLALPQLWERQHDWWVPLDNYHLIFPANIEIVWGYAFAVGGLHIPRLLTFLFAILTIGGMRRWIKERYADAWIREFSLGFFLITPLVMVTLSTIYVEWPLFLCIFLGWWASRQHITTGKRTYAAITAMTWGISPGIKYSALPVIALLGFEWFLHLYRGRGLRASLRALCLVFIGVMVFSGPWFVRNAVLTDDPLYPLGLNVPFYKPPPVLEGVHQVDYLTRYVDLSGFWRWYPWLYHTTIERMADQRMHPGWLCLHLVVLLCGWKRWQDKPWLTVVMLSLLFFAFSPSPRIYFPLMGLTWLFLPDYLSILSQRRRWRGIFSVLLGLFIFPSLSMGVYYWFTGDSQASQEYLLGLINDQTLLRKDGLLTPVMEWVRSESPEASRLWLWCDNRILYFDRWVRPSPAYEFPVFLNIVKTKGAQGLSQEIRQDHIEYIVINTSNCPLPLQSGKTKKEQWTISADLQRQVAEWMQKHVRLMTKDDQFELYEVIEPASFTKNLERHP